jgi:hypothetical protein
MTIKAKPIKRRGGALTDMEIAEALRKNKGMVTYAADSLGYDRGHVCSRVKESPFLQEVQAACVEARLDVAEYNLSGLVEESDLGAICFLLKTIGKRRGYIEDKGTNTVVYKDKAQAICSELGFKEPTDGSVQS